MQSRRRFLAQASCAAVSAVPILNTLLNLGAASSIANASAPAAGEYRALVCLFQSGGHDSFNLLIPYSGASPTSSDAFAEYTASRADLALPKSLLHEIHPMNTGGRTFGVHPSMPKLAALFEAKHAAFLANVGTLVEPVFNRQQVAQNSRRLPLGLYSHSDQIQQWQTSVPQSRSAIGWAGRIRDLLHDLNSNQTVSMNISTDGGNTFQTGITGAEYAVEPGNDNEPAGGAVPLTGYFPADNNPFSNATREAINSQLALNYSNVLQQTYQKKRREAKTAYALYSEATSVPLPGNITFPNTSLGRQLKQVALAIAGRTTLGALRQTFFVNRDGWDHHSDTLASQLHMLAEVDDALAAFWAQLGALGLQNQVTLFSASDFGRTLTSNNRGSDHAWGGNHFILGGRVLGKRIYGKFPSLAVNPDSGIELNPLDTGRGRLIPTTSCDEYFAEMALWLGVPASSLPLVLPNIGNFYSPSSTTPPLGFLA